MEFLDEMLELQPNSANLTPSREGLESQRSPSPGTCQTPSLSQNPMHLPPLLKCSQVTLPQQFSTQLSTSAPSSPTEETKPIFIQSPSPGLDDTQSVSAMHLPAILPYEPTQPQLLPILILTPSRGPGQTPSISTVHSPPLLQSSHETQQQQSPLQTSRSPSPSLMLHEETTILEDIKPILIEMLNEDTRPSLTETLNEDTKPIFTETLNEDTKPIFTETLNEDTKPILFETLNEDTKPIFFQALNEDTKPILNEDTNPVSIQMPNDETESISIEMIIEPISIQTPTNKRPQTKKRKKYCNVDDFGLGSTDKVLNYLRIKKRKKQKPPEWDSVEYLFMSYAKSFKQLSLRKQVKIKMALEKLLVESEKGESENKSTLCPELYSHEDNFFDDFHMSRDSFEELHYLVRPYIEKMDTNYRKAIGSRERLAVCLRFIRTGTSFIAISHSFRIGRSTVSMIVDQVSKAIWECLQPLYMPSPTENIWKQSEVGYQEIWNFPNCVGSVGGKHVMIQFCGNNGSIVLFAIIDPFHNFIAIDVGSYGEPDDSNLFDNSAFYNQHLHNKKLLPPKPLPGTDEPVPQVLIGDEAFPLQTFLMRPFPAAASVNDPRKQTYNHRLGHARSVVENTFRSLRETWRVFQKPLECNFERTVHVTKAACCLHNFVRIKHGDMMPTFSNETTPSENSGTSSAKFGIGAFMPLRPTNIRSPNSALAVRETFLEYFNREIPE